MEIDWRLVIDAAQLIVWIMFLLLLFGIMGMYIHETKVLQKENKAIEEAIKLRISELQSDPDDSRESFSYETNQLIYKLDNLYKAITSIDKVLAVEAVHREYLETLLNQILQEQNSESDLNRKHKL